MPFRQRIDRDDFLNGQSRRFAISHLLRDRRNSLDQLFDVVEQETEAELQTGETNANTIEERVRARVLDRGRRGEFGNILVTLAISVITQILSAYIQKLIQNWINPPASQSEGNAGAEPETQQQQG